MKRKYHLSRLRSGLLVLRAAVGGAGAVVPVTLLIDTGATYTMMRPDILKRVGCDLDHPLQEISIVTAGGMLTAPMVAVPWFHCPGQRISSWKVVAHLLPTGIREHAAGLLGMDFLARFGAVIHTGRAEIWLEGEPETLSGIACSDK